MSDFREIAIDKIMKKSVLCEGDFGRMTELRSDEYEEMENEKPVFPYSQDEVAKMTKEEYRAAFNKWECETADHYVHCRFSYDKFEAWNRKCLNEMSDDDFRGVLWLCAFIAKGNVRNMDMESCGEFHTAGIYFNNDKKLVIYNGR